MTSGAAGFEWDLLMRAGVGALGLSADEFWAMTPREFTAAVKGRLGQFEDKSPMDFNAFSALSTRFPDQGAT
ncbi:MAG: rcc01693 family protein [Paracoccaceae bacterium]